MANRPNYSAILRDAEQARWSLDEGTRGLVDLDFGRPFLPQALVHSAPHPCDGDLTFLDDGELLVLNQIRGHAYLGLSVLGERFVVTFVMSEASRYLYNDAEQFLALMGFGQQAAKHMAAFQRFSVACKRGFNVELEVVGPAADILARFLTQDTLAMGLLVLHLECATQPHCLLAERDPGMDEHFRRLLQLHWREGSQNVRLTELMLGELAPKASLHQRERAVEQYTVMLNDFSSAFRAQVELDLAVFQRALRPLSDQEQEAWRLAQRRSYNDVFLQHGLEHPAMKRTLAEQFGRTKVGLDAVTDRSSTTPRGPSD